MVARKYLAFDIETAKEVPGADFDWRPHRPLGIACAATLCSDAKEPIVWYGKSPSGKPGPQMSNDDCKELVTYLVRMAADGYTIVTWNGLGFDFDVLSEESTLADECKELALNHVDLMFHIFCDRGFPVSLAKAAEGLRIPGKQEGVTGIEAPRLWASGRHDDVMAYVTQDVRITMQVAELSERKSAFVWKTRSNANGRVELKQGWLAVRHAMRLPKPDTSWMNAPISRSEFTGWL